jgi:ribosomal protein S18 acetylase RimI-like enzyme
VTTHVRKHPAEETKDVDMTLRNATVQPATEAGSPGRWIAARVAHPVRDLAESAAFYRDLLGLQARGGFTDHDGYSGVFFGLPGGGELELTAGPVQPRPGTDDLLVLYLADPEEAGRRATDLKSAGVPTVPSPNPYWERWGQTFLDPDGYAVVVAAVDDETAPPDATTAEPVRVEPYTGERERLRTLFELAEDSAAELDSYLHAGRVLVAVAGGEFVGHLQLLDTDQPWSAEIKNMAVREDLQGCGIGGRLIRAAAGLVAEEGRTELLVATAAAATGNLRFYQRQGFRLRSIERDAFSPATGYRPGFRIDGIDLRDRVWLDRPLGPPLTSPPPSEENPQLARRR